MELRHQEGKQPELDRRQIESAPFEPNFEFALINLKSIRFTPKRH